MAEKQNMTVPEYYPKFQCKCGSCRSCCCAGWGVSISRDDYFRLESVQCSASLRRRLDRAFFLLPDATPERYAGLSHDWSGRCWLQREDGFCALQRTCGEASGVPALSPSISKGLSSGMFLRQQLRENVGTASGTAGPSEIYHRGASTLVA